MNLYPLQFEPILKERIWGGEKLKTILDKPIVSQSTGESWELSAVDGFVSVISNGSHKGKSLIDLINESSVEVLGIKVYERFGKNFPLLFKFLDASKDLSIQVHPDDAVAIKRHNSFGKTEMWYVMQADEDARIILGFKEKSSASEYIKNLENKTLLSILDEVKVKEGDAFFIEAGTVHAVGAGMVIAEIQQTSDITYRLYDFDRVDSKGNTRELHVELALDVINYDKVEAYKEYTNQLNQANTIVDCSYFTTNSVSLEGELIVNRNGNSFTVYMCVNGDFEIRYDDEVFKYKKGDTILIPGGLQTYELIGKASLLEIYIS